MKILQVTPRYPPRTGGVETHVKEISERLVKRGHNVVVHTADAGEDVEAWEVRNGVEVRRHRGFAPGGAFHVAPGIVSAVRQSDADLVHAHNYHSLPMFFASLGRASEAFVVTPHYHGGSESGFRGVLLELYHPVGGWAVRGADRVIAVSDWERAELVEGFGVDPVVIENGVDVERFVNAEPEHHEQKYLLTVGRLEQYKGVQHVIRAMEQLPGFELWIAGTGPYEQELRKVARDAGFADRVRFLGFVDSDDLPGIYAGASAFLSLSEFEAYGMTVGEAVAAGTPCVVREVGGLRDWIRHDGCIGVTSVSPKTVAEAVHQARDLEPCPWSLSTWGNVTDRVEAEYNSVLSS